MLRLADLPTEEDHFRAEQTRKVDQSLLHAFTNASIAIDLIDAAFYLANQLCDLAVVAQPMHQVRRFRIESLSANHRFAGAL